MSDGIICWGAGTTGRIIARNFKDRVLCFVDSDSSKMTAMMEGFEVLTPLAARARYPDATWIASTIIPTFHAEIEAEIAKLGVKTIPVWGFLPQRTTPPSPEVALELITIIMHDRESYEEVCDQIDLRNNPQHHTQRPPSDIREIYFPDFILHREDEHYVDCGAADGDTITSFIGRWPSYEVITAFEPDAFNLSALKQKYAPCGKLHVMNSAVGDMPGPVGFQRTGDYSARVEEGGNTVVNCIRLDDALFEVPPTYIKMDIEGSELEALWGARRILKEHSPVLAICAYHEASHFWEVPLLLHALQPEYKLFFRRYAQGSFEIIWYAVPPDRVRV